MNTMTEMRDGQLVDGSSTALMNSPEFKSMMYIAEWVSFFRSLGNVIERKAAETRWAANAAKVRLPGALTVSPTRRRRR